MFKITSVALISLLCSSALAASKCNPLTVTGSYVRQFTANPYIDQLKLDIDGTAYWFQSSSFDQFIAQGAFIPEVGSWTCLPDGSVLVTTVGTNYQSTGTGDISINANKRTTQKLVVLDFNTLRETHRIFTETTLSSDPLGPGTASGCTPTGTVCDPGLFRRIRPVLTDIP
jgi:hypothetical protein